VTPLLARRLLPLFERIMRLSHHPSHFLYRPRSCRPGASTLFFANAAAVSRGIAKELASSQELHMACSP